MLRFIPQISAFILLLALASCSTSTVTDTVELPYEEKIVIRGILTAGEPVKDILISRTVPVLAPQKEEEFWVKDAEASIGSDGKTFPLTLQEFAAPPSIRRTFYAASGLVAEAGKSYTLTVRWKGKTVTATTRIPATPMLVSSRLTTVVVPSFTISTVSVSTNGTTAPPTSGSFQIRPKQDTVFVGEANFLPSEGTVIRAGLELVDMTSRRGLTALYLGSLLTNENARNGALTVPSGTLPTQTRKLLIGSAAAQMRVYVLDPQYERYYATRSRGNQTGFNLFGGSSDTNVEWNVQGDGLGMFLGLVEMRVLLKP